MDTAPESDASSSALPTLLSGLAKFTSANAIPAGGVHPFAASTPAVVALLNDMVRSTDKISNSLSTYMTLPFSNPKVVSLLRQHATIASNVHNLEQDVSTMISAFSTREGIHYGVESLVYVALVSELFIERLKTWSTSVGMQFYSEPRGECIAVSLSGRILVIDIELKASPTRTEVPALKVSYAFPNPPNGMLTKEGSPLLNSLLKRCIESFLEELQGRQDPLEAEKKGRSVSEQLVYMMMLDKLAADEGASGVRWFKETERIASVAEEVAKGELEAVASSTNIPNANLDVFLARSHSLPLPYLSSPCLHFLVHVAPRAYLSILRSPSAIARSSNANVDLDIPFQHLVTHLSTQSLDGTALATLQLIPHSNPSSSQTESQSRSFRPMFPLIPISAPSTEHHLPWTPSHAWVLDFSRNGQKGLVMSQSRMRAIEDVVSPHQSGVGMGLGEVQMMVGGIMFESGSWVNQLLNVDAGVEQFTALYCSPSSSYPPLRLRLMAPPEPGFYLEQVHVRSMREVWGVLEIVREQCWMNSMLEGINWTAEGLGANGTNSEGQEEAETTEAELDSILNGTFVPLKIPINVYIPPTSVGAPLTPTILMTCPEQPPGSGLIEIVVHWDESKKWGVGVEVRSPEWSFGFGDVSKLEEICRRGGIWAVAGMIWAGSTIST